MKSNKKHFILIVGILLASGFLVTSLTSYFVSLASLRSKITLNDLPLTSDNVYSEIQRDILKPVFIASLMATDTFLRDWVLNGEKTPEQVTKYLKEIQTQYHTFTSFFVSEKSKVYYHSDGILKTVSEEEPRDKWYFRVRDMQNDYEINVDPDMANKDAMTIFINYRTYDYQRNYIGATGVGLTVNAVKNIIQNYQEKYKGHIFFVDKDGYVMLSGSMFPDSIQNISQIARYENVIQDIQSSDKRVFRYRKMFETFHINIRYISEFGWYLIVGQSEAQSTKAIFSTLLINLGIFVFVTSIVLILVRLAISAYQKRIETLSGIVPICSYCKKIRDDKGFWNQVELYIEEHSDAEFSHGICPNCQEKYFPDVFDENQS